MSGDLQSRFVRDLEARYAGHVAQLEAVGADSATAHREALEAVKDFGRVVLEELRARGLFPWRQETAQETQAGAGHCYGPGVLVSARGHGRRRADSVAGPPEAATCRRCEAPDLVARGDSNA